MPISPMGHMIIHIVNMGILLWFLFIFSQLVAIRWGYKKLNKTKWLWMTWDDLRIYYFSQHALSITFLSQKVCAMNNLLLYDFEKGPREYIFKITGTKSMKMIFLWRSQPKSASSLLLANMNALAIWQYLTCLTSKKPCRYLLLL